jgi:hypothetical protein
MQCVIALLCFRLPKCSVAITCYLGAAASIASARSIMRRPTVFSSVEARHKTELFYIFRRPKRSFSFRPCSWFLSLTVEGSILWQRVSYPLSLRSPQLAYRKYLQLNAHIIHPLNLPRHFSLFLSATIILFFLGCRRLIFRCEGRTQTGEPFDSTHGLFLEFFVILLGLGLLGF